VTYTSSNTNVATVLGSLVTIVSEGTTEITASQAGDSNWNAAASVTQTLTVQSAINRGLVAYYPFRDNLLDESGNNNHLTNGTSGIFLTNGPTGGNKKSLYFSSSSDSIRSIQNSGITGNETHTFSVWFKAAQVPAWSRGEGSLLMVGQEIAGGGIGKFSRLFVDDLVNSSGRIVSHGGYTDLEALNAATNYVQRWNHLAVVYSGTVSGTKIYLNGVDTQATLWSGGNSADTRNLNDGPILLGRSPLADGMKAAPGAHLADVRVYDRALTVSEIGQLYQQEAGSLDTDGDGLTDAYEQGYGRYQMVIGSFTWDQAKADAEAKGGHLATITSQKEKDFSDAFLPPGSGDPVIWLGATDRETEGTWKWVTGETWNGFTAWSSSNPNNDGNQDYLRIDYFNRAYWDDYFGTERNVTGNYFLEFGYPTDPLKADTDGDG
ncbi:MAG: hypothetical protein EBZ78_12730, partial [Verrucomicrobia bacterium]|nr:hypothetical protein [Verrucomicrobiota bacterium]